VVSYTIPGTPRSGKNSQRIVKKPNGGRFLLKSKAAAGWMSEAIGALQRQGVPTRALAVPCRVDLEIYQSRDTPDADNVQSLVWDALVRAGVLADDSLIDAGAFVRHRGVAPKEHRVVVTVRPWAMEAAA
jgi:Holliday junction resolvase RusA-like endonuclease